MGSRTPSSVPSVLKSPKSPRTGASQLKICRIISLSDADKLRRRSERVCERCGGNMRRTSGFGVAIMSNGAFLARINILEIHDVFVGYPKIQPHSDE